jgi:hypothetical protein
MSEFPSNPIEALFGEALQDALRRRVGLQPNEALEAYLTRLLVEFLRQDRLDAIRDPEGRPVRSISEMLEYGEVTQRAESFNQERTVHRHVGDLLLFWSGMFPEALPRLTASDPRDAFLDCTRQGQESYHVVSTFDHDPFAEESRLFKKLSEDFEAYQMGLAQFRASFHGFDA